MRRLSTVTGRRTIIGSSGWGQLGAVVEDGKFQMFPSNNGMTCDDWVIDDAYFYKFVISRRKDGTVTMQRESSLLTTYWSASRF